MTERIIAKAGDEEIFNFLKEKSDNLNFEIEKQKEEVISKFELAKNEELANIDLHFEERAKRIAKMLEEVSTIEIVEEEVIAEEIVEIIEETNEVNTEEFQSE
ncbi:MAG: hypothetical protein PHI36_09425 [Bacteroidales bacterium]|nr:hypothetical protein [Bacteroidales bacterium]